MDLTLQADIFIYLGVFTTIALILAFCLAYCCLKGSKNKKISEPGSTLLVVEMVKEMGERMVEMARCCFDISIGYRDREPSPRVWTCSCDIQIYSN